MTKRPRWQIAAAKRRGTSEQRQLSFDAQAPTRQAPMIFPCEFDLDMGKCVMMQCPSSAGIEACPRYLKNGLRND